MKRIIAAIVLFLFVFMDITVDFVTLKNLFIPSVTLRDLSTVFKSTNPVFADITQPYCLPSDNAVTPPVFDSNFGFCTTQPLDPQGKCPTNYVYSSSYKTCISNPLCPGATIWNAQTKQCETVTATPSGDTPPTFPENSCMVDSNGDGEIQENEIFQCIQTPQGYMCSQGQTPCNPQYTQPSCPSGYTYNGQTQKCEATVQVGVCSSQQVPVTDYQCPVNGETYPDLNQCNNACIQTASCNAVYNGPVNITTTCTGNCRWGCPTYGDAYDVTITAQGNALDFGGKKIYVNIVNNSVVFSGYISLPSNRVIYGSGNQLITSGGMCFDPHIHYSSVTAYYTPGGGISFSGTLYLYCGFYFYPVTNGLAFRDVYDKCDVVFIFTPNVTSTYTCPLGNYPCTGSPPTCQKGQACVTHSSTVTKYQCSLNDVQYDTQDQCTTSCHDVCPAGGSFNPATGKCEANAACDTGTLQSQGCFTGYGCPLGDYQCKQVNGQWMCSPYKCVTSGDVIDEGDVIPAGLEDDGPRDDQGNCLGTIYIFNGKQMRCRKSGLQTGFHNCCNESRGKLYDSTGSTGGSLSAVMDVAGAIAAVYQAVNLTYRGIQGGVLIVDPNTLRATFYGANGYTATYGAISPESLAYQSVASRTNVLPDGRVAYTLQPGGDQMAGQIMSEYVKNLGPQIAAAVVQMAVSKMIKDPVLSASFNLVASSILWALDLAGPVGFAFAVVQLGMSLFMARCDQQDIETSTLNDSRYCHEVGEYCVKKIPLIGCVQKAKGFCCFNSKLARIIHEQGRPQLAGFGPDGGWGKPKSPNCRGFLPEEFQALDFNKIDLSEYIEDIQRNVRQNVQGQMQQMFQNTMQQMGVTQ